MIIIIKIGEESTSSIFRHIIGKWEREKNKQKVEHWLWCLRASKNENIDGEKFFFSFSSLKENDQINEIRKQKRQNGGEGIKFYQTKYKQREKIIGKKTDKTDWKNTVTDIRLFFVLWG
jgi:hypothetical protein